MHCDLYTVYSVPQQPLVRVDTLGACYRLPTVTCQLFGTQSYRVATHHVHWWAVARKGSGQSESAKQSEALPTLPHWHQ